MQDRKNKQKRIKSKSVPQNQRKHLTDEENEENSVTVDYTDVKLSDLMAAEEREEEEEENEVELLQMR